MRIFCECLFLIMRFIRNFYLGIRSYWKAFRFILAHKFYWYIFIPAILMPLIYKAGEMISARKVYPNAGNMNEIVWFLIHMLIEISVALLLMNFAKYLVVILLSPLLAHLSQRTERKLTGNIYPFDFSQFLKDIKRGIRIAFRNILWQYFFFLIIFLVSFLGWQEPKNSPVFYLIFVISFYYYGFSFIDYTNERRKLDIPESIEFVRSNRGLAISIGALYSLMILVPVDLGIVFGMTGFEDQSFLWGLATFLFHIFLWLLAAAAPILAIVASTIAMNDLVGLKSNSKSLHTT